jgi:Tol biopolymer transport system component
VGRQGAIKALPEHFADDPERLARFEREARTLAALNHPNVAGIHGVEEHDGRKYLVLEYVEGETLADRLDRGSLPVDEALEICAQIAAGLEAAHEAGVIHRDLKPANVRLTPEGKAKVLDFGLARTEEVSSSGSSVSQMQTLTTPHSPTTPGAILGTAPYMSPEQARGRKVDKRSDIWSFGVVLYECLTGMSPFVGETATDSIGAILHKDVDLNRLPPNTPPMARHVIKRCLQRDRNERLRDIGDARIELENADAVARIESESRERRLVAWPVGIVVGAIAGGVGAWLLASGLSGEHPEAPPAEPRRYSITFPDSAPIAPPSAHPFGIARPLFDVSSKGDRMVYTAFVDGAMHLYMRDMLTGEVTPVPGGQDGFGAAFSRDGSELAFYANERLYRMDLDRRTEPQSLVISTGPSSAAWAIDGALYISTEKSGAIAAIALGGGEPALLSGQQGWKAGQDIPRLTPDDRFLLYTETTDHPRLVAAPPGRPDEQRVVVEFATNGWVTSTNQLLFMRGNQLMAARIDPTTMQLLSEPATVLSNVRTSWLWGLFCITSDGALIYAEGSPGEEAQFVWLNRAGEREPLDLGLRGFVAFSLSPDGRYLATPIRDGRDTDIWIYDLQRPETPARITFGGVHNYTCWSDDGRFLFFARHLPDGRKEILAKEVRSGAPAFLISGNDIGGAPLEYHAETGELLFNTSRIETGIDLMRGYVDLTQGAGATLERIEPVAATRYDEPFAAISPDRKWIVANSDETGRWELYLSSYPDFGSRVQISSAGGEEPRWTDDGSRIIYRWQDSWYEVEVSTEPRLSATAPRMIASGPFINISGYEWDMTGDGERLLLLEGPQQDTPVTELQVITNFLTELERVAPAPNDG